MNAGDLQIGEVRISALLAGLESGRAHVVLSWRAAGAGDALFGAITIRQDGDGHLSVETETMGKEFARRVLDKLIEDAQVVE